MTHSLNTLTHFGERLALLYDDPDNCDKFFRFQESLEEFFDLASKLEIGNRTDGEREIVAAAI